MMRNIRRREKEIKNEAEITAILSQTKYITIALCNDTQPYLVTLSHGYDVKSNSIFFHCASEGKKIDYIKNNNQIWGQALLDCGYAYSQCDHKYATVQFSGHIVFVNDIDRKIEALELMIQQLEKNPSAVLEKELLSKKRLQNITIGKIIISHLSGKKHKDANIFTN